MVTTSCLSYFNHQFDSAKYVEYKHKWANGTGYFNYAILEPVTELVSFVDDTGRRGIILPDETGNIVIFERYADGNGLLIIHFMKKITFDDGHSINLLCSKPFVLDSAGDDLLTGLIVRLVVIPLLTFHA